MTALHPMALTIRTRRGDSGDEQPFDPNDNGPQQRPVIRRRQMARRGRDDSEERGDQPLDGGCN
ncbi:uncharacterized protein PV09_06848 [Verruconis gallopava]|uniref:Uncharacterized protein n=1 Tax=Verruconis gallopava TaxID=253628 RepID=A0A0D2AR34_9PEZI|nr:uncharacterized protein PV09_06848 [Verruconis gallopava]KIW01664.1 hypothetical protein PV09_06848 [Verruconis gallopava]